MSESTSMVRRERRDLTQSQPEILEIHQKLGDPRFLNLLRDTYFKGCDEVGIEFCIETCRHLGLDPIAKQIWFVKIYDRELGREVITPIVGIAGLRSAAYRTGQYGGPGDPQWCGPDGVWRDVWLERGPPAACKVAVRRHGFDEPVSGIVTYASAVQTNKYGKPRNKWASSPAEMLAKCSEALALRRAFSMEVAGHYLVDEVDRYETADDRAFRVQTLDVKGLLADINGAAKSEDLVELGERAAELPDGPEKTEARNAWVKAKARIGRQRGKTKAAAKASGKAVVKKAAKPPEPEPEPEPVVDTAPADHDYGPEPLTDEQVAETQEAFGFDDTRNS